MQTPPHPAKNGLWLFFILTYALSWTAWFIVIASGMASSDAPGALLYVLGGCGPSIIALILVSRSFSLAERKDFWRRLVNFREIRPGWYALIFLAMPAITLLSIGLNALTGSQQPGYILLSQILTSPATLIPAIIGGIIGGPLAEELGWRGFALDRLIRRWGLLRASLLLSLIWSLWHLPLFFVKGTTQYRWGIGSAQSVIFFLLVIPLGVFTAYAYVANRRSILAAMLVHFMFNFALALISPTTTGVQIFTAVLYSLLVYGVVAYYRKKIDDQEMVLIPQTTKWN